MKSSENALREIREPLAQAQQEAITEYKKRHLKTE